jgi:DNA-directed RNA polymerase specialized sigma24 family protein
VCTLPNTQTPEGRAAFQQRLCEIRQDPEIIRLACRYAGGASDLADDALQEVYWAVARVKNADEIEDLRAYYCRAVINEVRRLHGVFRPTLVQDFESLAEAHQDQAGCHPTLPRSVEETAGTSMARHEALKRFSAKQADLAADIPGRSRQPGRYRSVISYVALQVLVAILDGEVSEADWDWALRTAYPEWFAEEGAKPDNLYQRFSRARADVKALLQAVVSHDEL